MVIRVVISRVTISITHIRGLIILLITTHEPLSITSCPRLRHLPKQHPELVSCSPSVVA